MILELTDAEKIETAFTLTCRKCGSINVRLDIEQGIDYGGDTGWQSGHITVGCNNCGDNDVYIWL